MRHAAAMAALHPRLVMIACACVSSPSGLVSESMAVLCAISVWMSPACQASGYYNGPGYPVGMSRSSMHHVWQLAEAELQRLKLVVSSGR